MTPPFPLDGKHYLMFVDDLYEDLELLYPKIRLEEAGAKVTIAGRELGVTYKGKHGYPCQATDRIDSIREPMFDGVVIPGGFAPDKLRRDEHLLEVVRQIAEAGKLTAAICHGGWIAASAGIYKGVRVTGSLGIKDDMVHAGAEWVDASVVVDRNFISSRSPADLPDFMRAILNFATTH